MILTNVDLSAAGLIHLKKERQLTNYSNLALRLGRRRLGRRRVAWEPGGLFSSHLHCRCDGCHKDIFKVTDQGIFITASPSTSFSPFLLCSSTWSPLRLLAIALLRTSMAGRSCWPEWLSVKLNSQFRFLSPTHVGLFEIRLGH